MRPDHLTPERSSRRPRHDHDIRIGRYYYGVKCPHCKDVSPHILRVNTNLIGARIDMHATDDPYTIHNMKHQNLGSRLTQRVRETMKDKIIEVTPTIIWSDGLVTEGAPYGDDNRVREDEMAEYVCVRSAVCYLKKTNPGMDDAEIDGLIEQVFSGRFVETRTREGVERKPELGVREITRRF